jgi:hypothetical protein
VLRIKEYFQGALQVDYSHIDKGNNIKDFFSYTPDSVKKYIAVISNPPFSIKKQVWEHLDKLKVPWAMLTNIMCLNYEEVGRYFANNLGLQILSFDRRISFDGNPSSFMSSYFCRNFLPVDLIFSKLENNNAKQYYIPSRMYGQNNYLEEFCFGLKN